MNNICYVVKDDDENKNNRWSSVIRVNLKHTASG